MQKPTELRGGYKFRILEFCLGDPVPPPALRPAQWNVSLLSAQLVLTYHNVCPYKNRISIRSEPASFVAAFTMERKNSGKKGVMKIGYTSIDTFDSNRRKIELCDSRFSRYKTCTRVIICRIDFSTTRVFNERELHENNVIISIIIIKV